MSNLDNAFVQATDELVALYRQVERQALDLPALSVMPLLIYLWASLRFTFFLYVGLFLIIPTNLVILIRNLFPGQHWRYRPFFLRHLYYVWLWIWRGEVPSVPVMFIRPLMNIFMKWHFESRIRRLRLEVALRGDLSDPTRAALLGRLDAALERWKSPRLTAFFLTVLLPGITALPGGFKQFNEFMGAIGVSMPVGVATSFVSENLSSMGAMYTGLMMLGYFIAIPVTAFLAKRGLFIGTTSNRVCFPGEKEGSGAYLNEREILGRVGLRASETPIDLWIMGFSLVFSSSIWLLTWDKYVRWWNFSAEQAEFIFYGNFFIYILWFGALFIAALRRPRTGRF